MSEDEENEFRLIDNNFVLPNGTLFSWLSRLLEDCDTLNIASAFFSFSNPTDPVFTLFKAIADDFNSIKVNLVVSNRLDIHVQNVFKSLIEMDDELELDEKEKQCLELLSRLNIDIYIATEDKERKSRFFHPKLYLFEKSGNPTTFIMGSGNFTPAGLERSVELLILEREQSRCQKINDWYENLIEVASRLSPDTIEKIQTISKEIEVISCGSEDTSPPSEEIEIDERIPIQIINLDEEEQFFYEFDLTSDGNDITLNGLDFTDLVLGAPDSINYGTIIAWALKKSTDSKYIFIKCKNDELLNEIFSQFEIKADTWVKKLEETYIEMKIDKKISIEMDDGDILIEILTGDGRLFHGKYIPNT